MHFDFITNLIRIGVINYGNILNHNLYLNAKSSLFIILMATHQKLHKSWKGYRYPVWHGLNVNALLLMILIFNFCIFQSFAIYIVYKLQFLCITFAVLLRDLSTMSFCNSRNFRRDPVWNLGDLTTSWVNLLYFHCVCRNGGIFDPLGTFCHDFCHFVTTHV